MRQFIRLHAQQGTKIVPLTISVDEFGAVQGQAASPPPHPGPGPSPAPSPSTIVTLKSGVTYTVVETDDEVIKLLRHSEEVEQNNRSNVSSVSNGSIVANLLQ